MLRHSKIYSYFDKDFVLKLIGLLCVWLNPTKIQWFFTRYSSLKTVLRHLTKRVV